jgi:hypothetical protein
MKKLINVTLMFAVCTIIALSGCKYEDGPGLSLRSKKARVTATWEFKKVRYNYFDSTSEYGDYTWEMRKDGTFCLNSKGRQAYIIFPGKVDMGEWDFVLDKEAIDFRYDDGRIERYNIKRLTTNDLWMEFIDSGDTRYMELSRIKWDLGK